MEHFNPYEEPCQGFFLPWQGYNLDDTESRFIAITDWFRTSKNNSLRILKLW